MGALRHRWIGPGLGLAVLAVALASLAVGSTPMPVLAGLRDWLAGIDSPAALVIGDIRLPRTLLALAVGACLGLAGAALQGLLRNPLADPGLTGASQGAALGAAAVFYSGAFAGAGAVAPALAGLVGAGIALAALLALSGSSRPALLILAGLAISSLASALLAAVLNFAPNPYALQELVFWLLGSVADRGMEHVWLLLPALLAGGALIWRQRRLLAALSLGEQVAHSMGLDFRRGGRQVALGTAILVGASVAVAGGVGFVGLIVPHLLRPMAGHRPDRLLLPSALAGAMLVCVADICVRLLPPGREVQLGVLTALLGAPLFIRLVWKERARWL
jgi:iron complex transport system permease protein